MNLLAIQIRIIADKELLVVCAPRHRLAAKRRCRPQDLAGERWVAFPLRKPRESYVQFLEHRLLAAGLEVTVSLLRCGFGCAARAAPQRSVRPGSGRRPPLPRCSAPRFDHSRSWVGSAGLDSPLWRMYRATSSESSCGPTARASNRQMSG